MKVVTIFCFHFSTRYFQVAKYFSSYLQQKNALIKIFNKTKNIKIKINDEQAHLVSGRDVVTQIPAIASNATDMDYAVHNYVDLYYYSFIKLYQ